MKKTITLLLAILSFSYTQAQGIESQKSNTATSQTSNVVTNCPTPIVNSEQPTCTVPTGTIIFASPSNTSLPTPTDLFISEVTDEDIGGLSYVEIYNGTGVTKNLSNYKLKVFSNGSTAATCDLALAGSLTSGAVFVISMGSTTNVGGVVPNMSFFSCGGVNINDAITLTSSTNTLLDLWGRTDGVIFTPAGAPGYTYRRLVTAVHPKTTWDPADWTALDPQDYTNVGVYNYQSINYQYSINGTAYQTSPIFSGLYPGIYQATVQDVSLGCFSSPITVTINAAPSNIVPLFDPVGPVCSGGSVPVLPLVSLNGISGTWSPSVVSNQVTTVYVFTTPFGLCATTVTLVIEVIPPPVISNLFDFYLCYVDNNPSNGITGFDVSDQTAQLLSQQALPASNYTVTYYTSQADANAGVNPIIDTANYTPINGQAIGVRIENITTGCYAIGSFQVIINTPPQPVLVSNNTLNTVYVDGSNTVVQPLLLDCQLSGNYSYLWQVDGTTIPNATSSNYLVDTASPNGVSRVYKVIVFDLSSYCYSFKTITVEQSSGVPSPRGATTQTFNPGSTLANLTVLGQNIVWYSSVTNKNVTSTPLPSTTPLVNGTTYYATQTIGGIESIARLPVLVNLALGIVSNEIFPLYYFPNPVESVLTLQSNSILKSVLVYNLLGQKVYEQSLNDTHVIIDLSNLPAGNYIARVQGETAQKVIKILKQ